MATALEVTSVQIKLVVDDAEHKKLKAHARVVLNDALTLTAIRVYDGSHGLFVSYPNDAAAQDYRQIFFPCTRELRDHIEAAVLKEYRAVLGDSLLTI